MAVYKLFPEKDATMYTELPNKNTGRDELLEASTYLKLGNPEVSRYLVKFSTSEISDIITTKIGAGKSEWSAYLRNFHAVVTGLNLDQQLEFYPAAGAWAMGSGRWLDTPAVTNGVSWYFLNYSGSSAEGAILWPTSGFPTYVTASWSGSASNISAGGGNWYTGSNITDTGLDPITQSQTFTYSDTKDVIVDVKNTVETWYSYSLNSSEGFANEGFLVKNTSAY